MATDPLAGDAVRGGDALQRDEFFMRAALEEARAAGAEGEVPIGAVVVCGDAIVARAHNRREHDADPSAHAEFTALVAAARALGRWRLTDCTVYVTLEPCCMCAGLMVNARVDRCVFGAADPKGGALGTLYRLNDDSRLNHAFAVTSGVLADACAAELRSFFVARRAAGRQDAGVPGAAPNAADGERAVAYGGAGGDAAAAPLPPSGAGDAPFAPRVLIAIDSFKGSAASAQLNAWAAAGVTAAGPRAQITCMPIADGGEGTVDAVQAACGGALRTHTVADPWGRPVRARYLLSSTLSAESAGDRTEGAVIEMAEAAGIRYSSRTWTAALGASTRGVGELVLDAIAHGARRIYLGLGGSATSDGGAGFLQALGARLLDAAGDAIAPGLFGLRDIASIDLAPARAALGDAELVVLTDVRNPLVGPRGAVRVFGPQKGLDLAPGDGADEADIAEADGWMAAYAERLTAARDALDGTSLQVAAPGARPRSLAGVPGSGAAGGLAAAALALGGRLLSGVDALLDLTGFDEAARTADLVITGEGALDAQTSSGKAPVGIARRAKRAHPGVPVVAVCGGRDDDVDAVYAAGIDLVLPVCRRPMSLAEAMDPAETARNVRVAAESAVRALLLGRETGRGSAGRNGS